jgi:hypothetical protein
MRMSRVAIAAVFLIVGALILVPLLTRSSAGSKTASKVTSKLSPTHSITIRPKPTHRPSPSPTPHKKSPSPSTHPAAPLTAAVSAVRCPGRMVQVTVTDVGTQAEDYAILQNGSISVADRITPGAVRKTSIVIDEGTTTAVSVTWGNNQPLRTVKRTAACASHPVNKTLPFTGPDRGLLIARIATGVAAMLTGIIIFWYGRLWPRRRDRMFD